ncbi:autotransporter domain-containing protein [Oricola sp.]|uniref:autotransporter domain-containing protein n=1 Tax=Oricola sp. TaxID=1979950 RepID=UPI00355965BF
MEPSGNSLTSRQSVSVSRRLHLLLATSALTVVLPVAGVAQEIIDGTSETVIGTGGGTQASPWYVGGLEAPTDLTIGSTGTGTLAISAGGVVADILATIGDGSGSEGTVTVDGAGATWTNSGGLFVGDFGTGTLAISDGGAASNTVGVIGRHYGSTGTVTVDGPDSIWTNSHDLYVGGGGTGALGISAGGAVTNASAYIASDTGSTGTATVNGAGSSWTNSGSLTVGGFGTGTLTIADGGKVTAANMILGSNGSGEGSLYLNGTPGARGTLETSQLSKKTGLGTVIFNGGILRLTGDQADLYSGFAPGNVTTAAGGAFIDTQEFSIETSYGLTGIGGLTKQGTGTLTLTGANSFSGQTVVNEGMLIVDGGSMGASAAIIGELSGDDGALTIQNGGEVSNTFGSIGTDSGSTGTVTVEGSGSSWTNSGDLYVGLSGTGTLDISAGGAVSNTSGFIGTGIGSTGTVTVDGAGSSWTNSDDLYVGYNGTGTLDISAGGAVSNARGLIGRYPGSNGTVTVDGAGSRWTNLSHLVVGLSGTGTLHISDGGAVSNARGLIGSGGSNGTVTVDGPDSSWTNSEMLFIGDSNTGTLDISAGGAVSNTSSFIGTGIGSTGTVTVDGAGSSWTNSGDLYVGYGGTGSLDISTGGTVNAYSVSVAVGAGSTGTINIGTASGGPAAAAGTLNSPTIVFGDGDGTVVFNHTDTGYDFGAGISGNGEIFHKAGETNLTGDSSGFLGETRVYGGTLHVSGSLGGSTGVIGTSPGSSGTVTVEGSGSRWTNSGGFFVGHEGTGTLHISDGGTVSNSGGGIGTTSGSNGTVTVEGPDSSWTNSANFYVGNSGTGTLNISDGGAVSTSVVTVARFASSSGTINIGAASGEAAVAAGTLNSPIVLFGDGDGMLVFNHTASGHEFGADVSGDGQILQEAGDTILNGDSSGFSGTTSVSGGTLHVNGLLGGTIDVSGGVLGGSGTLGALTAEAGATVAPGNSIGTLNVGDTTFNAGSVYEVELNDGGFVAGINNDLLNASGTVTINGGTVNVTPVNGSDSGISYTLGSYTILTAAGGAVGTFDTLTDDYAFLDFALDYSDANSVMLNSSLAVSSFCQAGMTANQCATGEGAYSLGFGDAMFNALLTLANDEAPGAMDQLSGEIHASAKTVLLEDSRFPREAAQDRLRLALGGVGADNRGQVFGYGGGFWAQGFGAWSQQHGNGNAAAVDRSIGGFILGADTLVLDDLHVGVLGGYSRSSFSVDSRASSGTADTYTLGAYAGRTEGAFSLKGGVAHSWHSLVTSRQVGFTGFSDNLTASYSASTLQTWGDAAYSIDVNTARFEPFANLAFVNLSTDGFTESGGASALTASGQSTSATFTTLGVRGDKQVDLGAVQGTLSGEIGWRHTFGNTPTVTQTFAAGGSDFSIAGVPLERDSLVLGAGFDVDLTDGASLGLIYSGQFGSSGQDHSAKANLTARF